MKNSYNHIKNKDKNYIIFLKINLMISYISISYCITLIN